ncbi:hypothetical protein HanIR_Chr08g0361261 [Helianthus annuus]|nr:hypothetical protein HanIR_Chr08g0361261 [Helianthus annuus]
MTSPGLLPSASCTLTSAPALTNSFPTSTDVRDPPAAAQWRAVTPSVPEVLLTSTFLVLIKYFTTCMLPYSDAIINGVRCANPILSLDENLLPYQKLTSSTLILCCSTSETNEETSSAAANSSSFEHFITTLIFFC